MVAITPPPYWHKNDVVAICFVALDLKSSSRLSSGLPGVIVATTQDDFWGCHRLDLLCLSAKLSHVGADVDGLAGRLHRPMDCG
jgi:hypothetical protein